MSPYMAYKKSSYGTVLVKNRLTHFNDVVSPCKLAAGSWHWKISAAGWHMMTWSQRDPLDETGHLTGQCAIVEPYFIWLVVNGCHEFWNFPRNIGNFQSQLTHIFQRGGPGPPTRFCLQLFIILKVDRISMNTFVLFTFISHFRCVKMSKSCQNSVGWWPLAVKHWRYWSIPERSQSGRRPARLGTGRDDRPGQANTLIFAIKLSRLARSITSAAMRCRLGGGTPRRT